MQAVYDFLKANPVFFVATADGSQPQLRPFGAVARFEGRLYICMNVKKAVYKQLIANPRLALCAIDGEGGWLRILASAVEDDRPEARAQMLEENPVLKGSYAPDDGLFTVFYLAEATATLYPSGGRPAQTLTME